MHTNFQSCIIHNRQKGESNVHQLMNEQNVVYKYLSFFKSSSYTIPLLQKDLHYHLFSLTKEIKENFHFYKKKAKSENSIQVRFADSHWRGSTFRAARVAVPSSSPGTTLNILASSPIALTCICDHRCFIFIYFVHLIARCVLRYQP